MGTIDETNYGYTNQEVIPSLGLMDYNARMYDPNLGRWTQPDSIVAEAGSTQGYNRYSYSNNNPLKNSDPTGHFSEDQIKDFTGHSKDELSPALWKMLRAAHFGDILYGILGDKSFAFIGKIWLDNNGQLSFGTFSIQDLMKSTNKDWALIRSINGGTYMAYYAGEKGPNKTPYLVDSEYDYFVDGKIKSWDINNWLRDFLIGFITGLAVTAICGTDPMACLALGSSVDLVTSITLIGIDSANPSPGEKEGDRVIMTFYTNNEGQCLWIQKVIIRDNTIISYETYEIPHSW